MTDGEGFRTFEWWVVYYPRVPHYFWAAWLKQGFRHCELWKPEYFGDTLENVVWLRVTPTFEILEASIDTIPTPPDVRVPGCTVQKVTIFSKAYKVRQWFQFGPISCTEICKSALGINNFWIRTPWQLYKHIKRQGGVLKHE